MGADLAQEIDVIQIQKPVRIVDHQRLAVGKVDKAAHLLFKAVAVVLNSFLSHHLAHISTSRRVADHTCSAAQQSDRSVSCLLETFHQAERHKMSHMQGIRGRVKPDVKRRFSVVNQFSDLFFVRHLSDQAAGYQFVIDFHFPLLLFSLCSRPFSGRLPSAAVLPAEQPANVLFSLRYRRASAGCIAETKSSARGTLAPSAVALATNFCFARVRIPRSVFI